MENEKRNVIVLSNPGALACDAVKRIIAHMQAGRERLAICLTGGASPRRLYELLGGADYKKQIPWDIVHWFIGDERFVSTDNPLSNIGMARRIFLDRQAPPPNIHAIPTDAPNPDAAARLYERELHGFYGSDRLDFSRPLFDVVLMGLGPDGHTAALFPHAAALGETSRWVVGVQQANVEPFVPRVTLTYPTLASCHEMLFLVSGAEKHVALSKVFAGDDLPATRARSNGEMTWLIDAAAAGNHKSIDQVSTLIVMGVSGSGKSTIGSRLAKRLQWTFEDGDSFHPKANVEKMCRDTSLTDEDRLPWLEAIAAEIDRKRVRGERVVIACSALKRVYRDILTHGRQDVRIVYLKGDRKLITSRLTARKDHFMSSGLLESQFKALQEPSEDENPIVIFIDASVDLVVDRVLTSLERDDAGRIT